MSTVLRSACFVMALAVAGITVAPSYARAEAAAVVTHDEALKTPAGKFVQDLGNQAIAIISNKAAGKEQRAEKFRNMLRNSFDLMTIGRFVIGRSWNAATPEEQKEYMNLFEELVIKTYGDRMSLYTGEGFVVTGVRPETEKDTIVNSQITHPDGSKPATIDWRVRQRDGKLGVIDVVVEGVSLSVTQRQEYAAVIQNNDGKISALLDKMREQVKVADDKAKG